MFNRPKREESDAIQRGLDAFLARGGEIRVYPPGASAELPVGAIVTLAKDIHDAVEAAKQIKEKRRRGSKSRRVRGDD